MSIIVIQPDECVTPSRYGHWLSMWNIPSRTLHPTDPQREQECRTASGIIILGGRMSARDHHDHPWLADLYQLVKESIKADIPLLGICLGHQIIAEALGGSVELNSATAAEEGPVAVALTEAGSTDPVLGVLRDFPDLIFYESHHDAVTDMPPGARTLAESDHCPIQAFRVGSALGVQFHPEASPGDMETWWALDRQELADEQRAASAHDHRSLCERTDSVTETLGYLLLRSFLDYSGITLGHTAEKTDGHETTVDASH